MIASKSGSIVLLSSRDSDGWWKSANDTIFQVSAREVPADDRATAANVKARLRMATLYAFANHLGYRVVGIDVGRGWIRATVADLSGQVVAQQSRRNAVRSASAVIDLLGELLDDLAEQNTTPANTRTPELNQRLDAPRVPPRPDGPPRAHR
mgnify:CR=1 FL=1